MGTNNIRVTKRAINAALKAAGFDGEAVKGAGYIYFDSPTITFYDSMVMTPNFSDLPTESWVSEYRSKLEEALKWQ